MQLSSLYMANVVDQVFQMQESMNKQREEMYQTKIREYTQDLNKRLVKVSLDKSIQESAFKKDIEVLRSKVKYLTKEGSRLRAIIDEREDDIRLLL
jgi:DNA-binding protein YbaB